MNEKRLRELKTMPYEEYLQTPEWQALRDQVLERDGYRCMLCNTRQNLHVHHRTYARRGYEELEDLTTLCQEDHEHFHKRMRTSDAMSWERRYEPPREVKSEEERRKEDTRHWEDYLNGLLLRDPGVCLHVCGIISEGDFVDEDTKILYNLLNSAYQRNASLSPDDFEQLIPAELQETASRARKRVEPKVLRSGELLVKEAIGCAVMLKRVGLLRQDDELKSQIQEAAETGDKARYRQLLQEHLACQRQIRVIDASRRLKS